MRQRQPDRQRNRLPKLWLLTDARNDAVLQRAILRLPRGSGVVFRHYHLSEAERRKRFAAVRRLCRARGHWLVLSGSPAEARRLQAHGSYGDALPGRLLATAHDLFEIGRANRSKVGAVLLSSVFPTRSHPGGNTLGPVRFLLLAQRALVPVIALGGMTRRSARRLPSLAWAAIDGLAT